MKLAIVIAAYDEAENIKSLYQRLEATLTAMQDISYEIIFVVEGLDGTYESLKALASGSECISIDYRARPSGLGVAFRRGFASIADDSDYVVTLDADLNHQPEEIPRLLEALLSHEADIVIGSRFVAGSKVQGIPLWKRTLSGSINWTMGWFFGLAIRDKTSGFRIYRAAVLRAISYQNNDFAFLPEILIKAARIGCKIAEEPIHFTFRQHGQSKMGFAATGLSYVKLFVARLAKTKSDQASDELR